jgi:hypothetical protein
MQADLFKTDVRPAGMLRHLPPSVTFAFDCMGIADELLRAVPKRRRDFSPFIALRPTRSLEGKTLDLYRAHARELVDRVQAGAKQSAMEPATDAELLCAVHETSLKAPLTAAGMAVAATLFGRCFPNQVKEIFGEDEYREPWRGYVEEQLATMRRKFTVSGRGLP